MEGIDESDRSLFTEGMATLSSKTCPFARLSVALRTALLSTMPLRRFEAGEHLFKEGDPGDHLLVILSGTAYACVHHVAIGQTVIGSFGPGDVVGEISLLTGEGRTADVVSRTPVRTLALAVTDFEKVAAADPEVRMLLTDLVADRLGKATYDGLGGKDIHGYQIVRCTGRGGMGIVYQANRLATGETVAVKMMNHSLLYHVGAVQRFQREAETLASLRHGSIARLYESFPAYGTYFLVMEFCDGATLKELLWPRRSLDESVVKRIVGQLACALSYIHQRGLIHRDLKPSNLMLTRSGVVKLLDFGLVKDEIRPIAGITKGAEVPRESERSSPSLGRAATVKQLDVAVVHELDVGPGESETTGPAISASNVFRGTPRYMAPEQFVGRAADHRADIYALGCVAYEALVGRPVSQASDVPSIRQEKEQFIVPPAGMIGPGVTPEMHEFLVLSLDPNPGRRAIDLDALEKWAGPIDPEAEVVTFGRRRQSLQSVPPAGFATGETESER